ncbi:FMN reductase (NADPH) [Lentzea sp. NBRC 105346]|uniref:NAD(P)H-dependent oxidoreductase n=1 Tax=Lentzea sp. NBRC 105346 TaxID=3032205 RepID=UPI0024A548A1|nr:NAD(P)H-dependent oxidoreductase [Lentzea sp. NBRC 105346]GLZ35860.1 FMN reductase (NADPH) [Lentzea sp. NBRC 105346]
MAEVLIISGAPSSNAATGVLVSFTRGLLEEAGHDVRTLHVRDLPTISLLTEDLRDPEIGDAVACVLRADGIVVASPVYRAAYSGLVKSLLDMLPKKALRGRAVLPLATGGNQGFLVAMDYALHPLLASKGADQVVRGEFVLDQHVAGGVLSVQAAQAVRAAAERFTGTLTTTRLRRAG